MPLEFLKKYKHPILIILIILSGFFVYSNSLLGDFIWDDEAFITKNAYIKDWSKAGLIFTTDSGAGASTVLNFYRPLQVFSCMIDYSLWGFNPVGYHLTCIILHILVALAIYALTRILFSSTPLAFFSAILFVTHPINTEAVSYISGRADLLSGLFILLCFIFYIKNTRSPSLSSYIMMAFSCVLAFLSKENSLAIVPILLFYHYTFKQKISWKLFLVPLMISLAYLFARLLSLQSFFFGWKATLERIPGFFAAVASYFRLLFLPFDLHMEYGNKVFSVIHPQVLFGLAVFLLLIFFALKRRGSDRLFTFSIFWFFAALLPTNSVYPINSFYMAEHWLYLPAIGFFWILARALDSLYQKKQFRLLAIGVFICFLFDYSYFTIKQNNYWSSEPQLYRRILRYTPGSYMVHNNLGNLYSRTGNKPEAANEYFMAIKYNPDFLPAYCSLLNILYGYPEMDAQAETYLKAAEAYPICAKAYYLLGNNYYDRNEKEKSIAMLRKAIELKPDYLSAYNNLASGYAEAGNLEEAIKLWNEAVRINPDFAVAHFNLAVYYFKLKQYELAIKHCDTVLKLGSQVDPKFLNELEPFRKKKI
ncbi:MAG: tetratricopeptide repeat protein [Candidatus Omnitrophota bacterium]